MASVTHETGSSAATIGVQNPATGELITTVPLLGEGELRGLAARARAAQPAWEALGFEGRGAVLRRARKWMVDNDERVISVVCSESGKTYEDAQIADYGYTVAALGFWAKQAPRYLADEHVP
jgi:acyl-CoA reductase-like NAD-dependent aldehyde dehydrogenase